jgi:hypothetical protein
VAEGRPVSAEAVDPQRAGARSGAARARVFPRPLALAIGLAALASMSAVHAEAPPSLTALDDSELAEVNGRDGLAFNISGFSLAPLPGHTSTFTYAMPQSTAANPYTLTLSNFTLSRTDDASPFTDPYYLDVVQNPGLADIIRLSFPQNATLAQLWNFGADLNITADGASFDLGNLQLKNLAFQGGGLDITAPATVGSEGVTFGLSLKLSLDGMIIRPRGLADSTEMLAVNGVHIQDANTGGPWAISDATRQPGIFNAITDPDGSSYLHLQIGWPTTTDPVPTGSITIDKIAFTSNVGGVQDFGSSRIAGIQLNYMDVKFRPGP